MSDWTAPKTWVENEILTYEDMNTYVRDNMLYLFERPADEYTLDGGTNYTTVSLTPVDVDAINLNLQIIVSGGPAHVAVHFHGVFSMSVANHVYLDLAVNGVREAGNKGIVGWKPFNVGQRNPINFTRLLGGAGGLAVGTYNIKLQWWVGAGTATLYNNDVSSAANQFVSQFWAHQL
jgi:hypothetical protein